MNSPGALPKYDDLYKPILAALTKLGGSGSLDEINEVVIADLRVSDEQLEINYPKSGLPVFLHRIAWARSYLKIAGILSNPNRGVWVLTEASKAVSEKSDTEFKRIILNAIKAPNAARKAIQTDESDTLPSGEAADGVSNWADQLLLRLQAIDPGAFERLCQRILRQSGFTRVEVSGKSGDGGIDGVGVLRMNLISFQVLFQCKRWKGSVGSEVVRNFRGAMQGRADKGLVITTGTFTADARREATRDGAPAIDLIDGEALCSLLKDLRLGVNVVPVVREEVSVNHEFFAGI